MDLDKRKSRVQPTDAPKSPRPLLAYPSSPACRCREFKRIGVEPITGACGCEISGVDLREPLDAETLGEIMKAFEQFLVIVFRDQDLTPRTAQGLFALFRRTDRTAAGTDLCRPPRHAGSAARSA